MQSVSSIISSKAGDGDIIEKLLQLPGTELNSLLLELFAKRAEQLTPNDVLTQFEKNRFVAPSTLDAIGFKQLELQWLQQAAGGGFTPVMLSPLAPLGTCAVFKTVHQNNVVSALRGTEVMSDATNLFALLIAQHYNKTKSRDAVKYVAAERLVRAQALAQPGHTAHFGICCMASGGFNSGGFAFEIQQVAEHLSLHLSLLSSFNKEDISIKILLKENSGNLQKAAQQMLDAAGAGYKAEVIVQEQPNAYYDILQFKTFLQYKGIEFNLSDGGFVSWTQQLLSNKKHRMLISGIGLELVYKLMKGEIEL